MGGRRNMFRKILIVCCLLSATFFSDASGQFETNRVEIKDGWFYLNGEKIFIKGVCFFEVHSVTGQTERSSLEMLDYEFSRIREAGFNAIRTQLSPSELALARAHGLLVLQGADHLYFSHEYMDPAYIQQLLNTTREIVTYSKPYDNILCYLIDNEPNIPDGLYRQGAEAAQQFWQTIMNTIIEVDPTANCTMASYPCVGFLDHSIFDCVSVNIYPYCPGRDTIGYRGHVEWFKRTYAAHKPLIVSEYGQSVADSETNMSERMMDLLDEQIAGGACGSFFFTWRTFGPEGQGDNSWYGIVPNAGETNDYRNEPRPIFNDFKEYFEAVVVKPTEDGCYTNSMPIEIYGSDRTGSMSVEIGTESFNLTRTGTYWWVGSVPVTGIGNRMVVIEARDTQSVVLVRKECSVHFVDPLESLTVSIEPETNRLIEGDSCRARILVEDQDGHPVLNQKLRVGVTETSRDLWTAITREVMTDEFGTYRFVWESAIPGYISVMAQPVADHDDDVVHSDTAFVRVDKRITYTNLLADPSFETNPVCPWTFPAWLCQTGWACRSGAFGMGIPGWVGTSQADISQIVSVTTGTYTFALWIREEAGYNAQQTLLSLDWLDAEGAVIAPSTVEDVSNLPQDSGWHPIFVTGTCTNAGLTSVRVMFHTAFGAMKGNPCSLMIDDAALYAGNCVGVRTLSNPDFEAGLGEQWPGTSWYAAQGSEANGRVIWAGHTGWGAGLFGWGSASAQYTARICQNLAPGTGTHTFSVGILREPNFLLTNMEICLGWYDASCSNKVQADTVSPFIVPPDSLWHRYSVTGSCTNADLYEVRATVFAQFRGNSNEVQGRGLKIDNARFSAPEPDTDNDTLPDRWEQDYFDSPTAAGSDADDDGDGQSNSQECTAGTDPTDPFSALRIDLCTSASQRSIGFPSSLYRTYTLQFSTNLLSSQSWTDLLSHIETQGGAMHLLDAQSSEDGYYRVNVAR